jgi:hypothetical protein
MKSLIKTAFCVAMSALCALSGCQLNSKKNAEHVILNDGSEMNANTTASSPEDCSVVGLIKGRSGKFKRLVELKAGSFSDSRMNSFTGIEETMKIEPDGTVVITDDKTGEKTILKENSLTAKKVKEAREEFAQYCQKFLDGHTPSLVIPMTTLLAESTPN